MRYCTFALLGLFVVDDVTTIVGARMGFGEANPLILAMRQLVGVNVAQVWFEAVRLAFLVGVVVLYGRARSRFVRVAAAALLGWAVFVVVPAMVGNVRMIVA